MLARPTWKKNGIMAVDGADQVAQDRLGAADRNAAIRDDPDTQAKLAERAAVEDPFAEGAVAPAQNEKGHEYRPHDGRRAADETTERKMPTR